MERNIIHPAIHGTTSILNSALKTSSIRRVVITSSIVAIVPGKVLSQGDSSSTTYNSSSRVRPSPTSPFEENAATAYRAAKALALDATDRFLIDKKPHFTIVNVMPGYVIGENALATDREGLSDGSNALITTIIQGIKAPIARPGSGCS